MTAETRPNSQDRFHIQAWLTVCAPGRAIKLTRARSVKRGEEREVWSCSWTDGESSRTGFLSVFKPGSLDSVNTSLAPHEAVEKCVLAMSELPALGIETPGVLGHARIADEEALLSTPVEPQPWTPESRVLAARILSRLHGLKEVRLSPRLRFLVRQSDPREFRTTGGQAPAPRYRTLVHGDYFSANLLPRPEGICVLDWETFGLGDPMWDLGFLIGADRDLPTDEIVATIEAYSSDSPLDRLQLDWHVRSWEQSWIERDAVRKSKTPRGKTKPH